MRKALSLLLSLVFLLSFSVPTFAEGGMLSQVTTFGFNDNRDRYAINGDNPPVLWKNWKADVGKSYSQPLILGGIGEDPVVIAAAGKQLHAWKSPKLTASKEDFENLSPLWSLPLKGDNPTKSHPTMVELNGRKLVFVGSDHDSAVNCAWLQVFDVTDITQPVQVFSDYNTDITDVVSAPLVLDWNGHPVCVITCGNTSRVAIFMNLDNIGDNGRFDPSQVKMEYLDLSGSGRTSSSPAPVLGGKGFAVGLDGGASSGRMVIYMLDDILGEENGNVILKSKDMYRAEKLQSGMCASFSVGDDDENNIPGRFLFYGDSRSRVYCYDVVNMTHLWISDYAPGVFSNRSPALGGQNVYFPAMGGSSFNDVRDEYHDQYAPKLLAIDRQTGELAWKVDWLWRFQTAPCIWGVGGTSEMFPVIFIGDRDGYLNIFNAGDGTTANASTNISRKESNTDIYAAGVTGEISSAFGLLAVTTEEGIKVWNGLPMDLEVSDFKTGIPDGEKAEIGKTYTASYKITYKKTPTNGLKEWPVTVKVGGFHVVGNTPYKAVLKYGDSGEKVQCGYDVNGNDDGSQEFTFSEQGEERTFTFDWTAQANSSSLAGGVNVNYPDNPPYLMINRLPELTMKNNLATQQLQVQGYDIKVKIAPEKTVYTSINGDETGVNYRVSITRKDDIPENVNVTGTCVDKNSSHPINITLGPGATKTLDYVFFATPGKYTIRAEAWPEGTDIYPPDNRDAVTITVNNKEFHSDSRLHVETLDGGPEYSR